MKTNMSDLEKLANHFENSIASLEKKRYQKINLVLRTNNFDNIKHSTLAKAVDNSFRVVEMIVFGSSDSYIKKIYNKYWRINFPRIIFNQRFEVFYNATYISVITYFPLELLNLLISNIGKGFSRIKYNNPHSLSCSLPKVDYKVFEQSTFSFMEDINSNFKNSLPEFKFEDFNLKDSKLNFGENKAHFLNPNSSTIPETFHERLQYYLGMSEDFTLMEKIDSFRKEFDDLVFCRNYWDPFRPEMVL